MIAKILLHGVAAQLTTAVATNFPDNLPIDPDVQAGELRGANLAVWEIHKIFYSAMCKALVDPSWPSPPEGLLDSLMTPSKVAALVPVLAQAISGNGANLATIVGAVKDILFPPAKAPAGGQALPNPGEPKK